MKLCTNKTPFGRLSHMFCNTFDLEVMAFKDMIIEMYELIYINDRSIMVLFTL